MSSKYNGWTNYETWNFNLHITNEESDYEYALEMAFDSEHEYELSKKLKEWANDMADDCISTEIGFIVDIIYSSIKEVNFYEVAEHLWEDRQEAIKEHDGEEE
jgi:predicted house-cleaning noncanonical NTP pyrophosphatase (MazG superfamily)